MASKISDEQRAAIVHDIAHGTQGCRAIARDHGVSHGIVSKIAKDEGLSFTRVHQTAAATAAARFDSKAARIQLVEDLYGDVQKLRDRMWSEYVEVVSSPRGAQFVHFDMPPIRDQRAAMAAIGTAIDKAIKLETHDGDSGEAQASTMLNDLLGAFQLAHYQIVAEENGGVAPPPGSEP